jgi:hypothetical protein
MPDEACRFVQFLNSPTTLTSSTGQILYLTFSKASTLLTIAKLCAWQEANEKLAGDALAQQLITFIKESNSSTSKRRGFCKFRHWTDR